MAIVLGANCQGTIVWEAIVLGGNCPAGNCPGGSCPGGNCSERAIVEGGIVLEPSILFVKKKSKL